MYRLLIITNLRFLICAAALYGAVSSICPAATYSKPEISSIMFHVDKLPLDKDRMKEIANDLIILASKNAYGKRKQLHRNARILAVVMRLDPMNEDAKSLNTSFSMNEEITEPDPKRYQRALKKTLQLLNILDKAEEHAEAHTFAAYLRDAIIGVASDHPLLKNHRYNKERWENVVPRVR